MYNELDYATSVQENNVDQVSLYPNPANNELNVNLGTMQNATLNVYSINGELISKQVAVSGTAKVDVSALSSGVYFTEVISEEKIIKSKFVVE